MKSRVLIFPVPRTPVFRRSGPLRILAALLLLLLSAAMLAAALGSGLRVSPSGQAAPGPNPGSR